jgi:hypothetical protein
VFSHSYSRLYSILLVNRPRVNVQKKAYCQNYASEFVSKPKEVPAINPQNFGGFPTKGIFPQIMGFFIDMVFNALFDQFFVILFLYILLYSFLG